MKTRVLLFLTAVIKAVDVYQDLLRVSVASAGMTTGLAQQAPPAIVSMYLGEELTEILEAIETGVAYQGKEKIDMEIGVTVLPHFPKDRTDRNRTSPFAFTGNKFEFRMLGSAFSIAGPNIVLNTAVADVLSEFAEILENASDFQAELSALIKKTIREHKRIIFNGNNYCDEWVREAEKRGLSNLKTTVDALPAFISQKSIDVFTRHHVFTEKEIHSRYEILMENYCKTLHIEALTIIDIVKKYVIPACIRYQDELSHLLYTKKTCGEYDCGLEEYLLDKISRLASCLVKKLEALENAVLETREKRDVLSWQGFTAIACLMPCRN